MNPGADGSIPSGRGGGSCDHIATLLSASSRDDGEPALRGDNSDQGVADFSTNDRGAAPGVARHPKADGWGAMGLWRRMAYRRS